MSDSLQPHESQYARPPCPSPAPEVYSNSCPSSRWCHPASSSSVIPFSLCPQSLPASGSFPMSQLFVWGGQGTGVSASASVLPMNTQIVATYLIKNIRYLFAEWVDVWMMSGWMDGCSWSLYVEFVTNHSPPLFFSLLFHSARLLRILFSHRTQQSYVHPSCCDLSSIHLMESVISKADSDLFLSWLRHKIYVCILLITLECLCFVSSWITYPTFI